MAGHVAHRPIAETKASGRRFHFQLATRGDDAELRALLQNTPMEGALRVTFRREPSFFDATAVEGPDCRVLTVRDISEDRVVGMGVCSARTRYVDGRPQIVGYLSGLRILPEYQGLGLLARGYRMLREVCREIPATCFLTTIAAGNQPALRVLTKGRGGLPHYQFLGRYHTFVLPLKAKQQISGTDFAIRPADPTDIPQLVEHLQQTARTRDFCPRYEVNDFCSADATFRNLELHDIRLAIHDGEIIGALGAWDQTPFRQIIVESYPWLHRLARPVYNGWAALRGHPRFPPRGQPSRHLIAAFPLVHNADPRIFRALLHELRHDLNRTRHDALMVGAFEQDPLLPTLREEAVYTYTAFIYLVHWNDEPTSKRIGNESLYLELGCL